MEPSNVGVVDNAAAAMVGDAVGIATGVIGTMTVPARIDRVTAAPSGIDPLSRVWTIWGVRSGRETVSWASASLSCCPPATVTP